MIKVERYNPDRKAQWDNFVDNSKNGTFLLRRDFMEYHSNRFTDHSLIIFDDDKTIALLPGSLHDHDKSIISHGGLTYGGLIMTKKNSLNQVSEIFDAIIKYLREQKIEKLIYKAIPHIYHTVPSEEDLYVLLTKWNANIIRRDISSTINLDNKIKPRRIRTCGANKAISSGIYTCISEDLTTYWHILNNVLQSRHNTSPVHSCDELIRLHNMFPQNIKLIAAFNTDGVMIAGTVLFITTNCIHAQYIAADEEGRKSGALDKIFIEIINGSFQDLNDRKYFDFGRSTESDCKIVNENLLYQKEGFGARGICYDTYEIKL